VERANQIVNEVLVETMGAQTREAFNSEQQQLTPLVIISQQSQ